MKLFFQFIVLSILFFALDLAIGFSLSFIVQKIGHPTYTILVIDELISFPLTLWNKLFPDLGVYRATSQYFWSILLVNAVFQAAIFVVIRWLIQKLGGKKK